ncbi:MAG TPA: enoyl-CoA hydratase/isomerase family protein [Ramlibacter sp.]|nr:enoyl-CoA hydratase/isomerase family protein [Ramlibacter sp.]
MQGAEWKNEANDNRGLLSGLLGGLASSPAAASQVRKHYDAIEALMAGDDLLTIARRLRQAESSDPWMQQALAGFAKGSPTSAAFSGAPVSARNRPTRPGMR